MSRIAQLTLGLLAATLAAGLVASALVAAGIAPASRVIWSNFLGVAAAGILVTAVTTTALVLRFMRWHFVTRRIGMRVPAVPALGAYIGSFALLPIPFFVGQLIARHRLLPVAYRRSRASIVVAFLWERGFDVWALALIGSLAGSTALRWVFLLATALLLTPPIRRALVAAVLTTIVKINRLVTGQTVAFDPEAVERAQTLPVLALGAASAVMAWLPVSMAVVVLGLSAGVEVAWLDWMSAAARSILYGSLSGIPFGAVVSGLALIDELEFLGVAAADAALIVFVFRMTTTWFTFAIGAVALLWVRRQLARDHAHDHFDSIDESYDAWLPDHYRAHMVAKKTTPMIERLAAGAGTPLGLDIGCGRGWYVAAMQRAGLTTVGMDMSVRQLRAARDHAGTSLLAQASANHLPFKAGAFDFAYVINVLHHLPSPRHQEFALREIARVVKPGGFVFIHEMNVRNPLFRWYMNYLFPILKGIDEGTEYFMDPRRLPDVPDLALREIRYGTFTPDFAPEALIEPFAALEKRLETSPIAPWGAHFLAVLERVG